MRSLDQGESFIVTRNGTPVGELTPLRRHRFVSTDTVVANKRVIIDGAGATTSVSGDDDAMCGGDFIYSWWRCMHGG